MIPKLNIVLIIFFFSLTELLPNPKVIQGVWEGNLDSDFYIKLDGEWEFYFGKLLESIDFKNQNYSINFLPVPSKWNDFGYPEDGYATYRVKIKNVPASSLLGLKLPHMNSSYRLYVNGALIAKNGIVSTNPNTYVPQHLPQIVIFYTEKPELEIILQVTNFSDNIGGIWDSIYLGNASTIIKKYWKSIGLEMFYIGFILIMSFYHFVLYVFRKKEKAALFFAFFCLIVVIRILITGEKILLQFFPNFPWEIHIKIEYLTVYGLVPLFAYFLMYHLNENSKEFFFKQKIKWIHIFKEEFYYPVVVLVNFISLLLSLITIFTSVKFYSSFMKFYQIFIIIFSVYFLYGIFISILKRKKGAFLSFFGFVFLFFVVLNDILYTKHIIHTAYLLPVGVFAFIFFQSLSLALKFTNAFLFIEELSNRYYRLITTFEKFVPKEFLFHLRKEEISSITLGDQITMEMAILIADIRGFTRLSEKLSSKETFEFVNEYLSYVTSVIRKNNGFIDKYLGDGFISLFPCSAENALNAAIEIQNKIKDFNTIIENRNWEPIRVGIGIHYGKVMLGVIGDSERMETTVISDIVNTCSRLEKLNKDFGTDIIISSQVLKKISNKNNFKFRYLGTTILRGKSIPVKIFELYNHYDSKLIETIDTTKELFYNAIRMFAKNKIQKSIELIEKVIVINPYDQPARYYYYLCKKAMNIVES